MPNTPNHSANDMAKLVTALPKGASRETLQDSISGAVDRVLNVLDQEDGAEISSEALTQVRSALQFLEQCMAMEDVEFHRFAKSRTEELRLALQDTLMRCDANAKRIKAEAEAAAAAATKATAATSTPSATEITKPAAPPPVSTEPKTDDPNKFEYERAEGITLKFVTKLVNRRLAYMRGEIPDPGVDPEEAELQTLVIDGVPQLYIFNPEFPDMAVEMWRELLIEARRTLARRIYRTYAADAEEQLIMESLRTEHQRDLISILALGLERWQAEYKAFMKKPDPVVSSKTAKKTEKSGGLGSMFKGILGQKKTAPKPAFNTKNAGKTEDPISVTIIKKWQKLEREGKIFLSNEFSFQLIAYILELSEKQFSCEYLCIGQIVDQQDVPEAGPVVENMSRLYKFYDQTFFDLVLLALFYRRNKFDINMLQIGCMSQKFSAVKLPLAMAEITRRIEAYAVRLIDVAKITAPIEDVEPALRNYVRAHRVLHRQRFGEQVDRSVKMIKETVPQLEGKGQSILRGVLNLFADIDAMKEEMQETKIDKTAQIAELVEKSLNRMVETYI